MWRLGGSWSTSTDFGRLGGVPWLGWSGGWELVAPKARGGQTPGMTAPGDIAVLRIELERIEPLIWRRVRRTNVDESQGRSRRDPSRHELA